MIAEGSDGSKVVGQIDGLFFQLGNGKEVGRASPQNLLDPSDGVGTSLIAARIMGLVVIDLDRPA